MKYNSSDDLNRSTAYLYVAKDNENVTASGFFFAFENMKGVFLVTNRHVAEGAKTITISLHSSTEESCYAYIANASANTVFHPQKNIDLCIIKMDKVQLTSQSVTPNEIKINILRESMVVSKEELCGLNYCEDVIMFGAPGGLYGGNNNLSIAYKGMTATHACTEFGKDGGFIVDIPSFPGSSGSAVYWCTPETMSDFSGTKLLGIFSNAQYDKNSPTYKRYLHLGRAVPAYRLLDFKELL